MEVLINLRRIERLDKDEFTEEERQEAEEIYEQRRAEQLAAEVLLPGIIFHTLEGPEYFFQNMLGEGGGTASLLCGKNINSSLFL